MTQTLSKETTEIAPPRSSELGLSASEIRARVQKIQQVMAAVMKEGTHYGQVFGAAKPSLWKAGAEVLFLTFELAPDLEVEDLSDGDSIRYRVTAQVRHVPTGSIVGVGVGEASSNEEKYRWREAVCAEEYEETLEDRRRIKYKKGRNGQTLKIQQVRTEPADIANTILKMAAKRCRVDAALSSTGASDIFAQDLEDLAEAGLPVGEGEVEKVEEPKATEAPAPNGKNGKREPETGNAPAAADAIPPEAWEEVKQAWHTRGVLSEKQERRLYAIAHENGWKGDDVVATVRAALAVDPADLPWGDPYDKVVAIFESFPG